MSGSSIIKMSINKKNGKVDIKVIGHDGTTCRLSDDHSILEKLMKNIGDITSEDNTEEFYEEKYGEHVSKQYDQNESSKKKKEKDLSLGFGV